MFGLEYVLALVKALFEVAFAIVTAIPAWIAWNCIAPKYLAPWVPANFLELPYWHVVAIFLVCTYLGENIRKLNPFKGAFEIKVGK